MEKQCVYRWELNNNLVRYSNGPNLLNHGRVNYSGLGLNTKLKVGCVTNRSAPLGWIWGCFYIVGSNSEGIQMVGSVQISNGPTIWISDSLSPVLRCFLWSDPHCILIFFTPPSHPFVLQVNPTLEICITISKLPTTLHLGVWRH